MEKILEAVPKDLGEALAREAVSFIPILGDVFNLAEAFEAFRQGKALAALIYLLSALPGPPFPLAHIIVHEAERRGMKIG
jgi:hypothetical protein